MICPKCGMEMEAGFMHVNGVRYPIQWFPKDVFTKKVFLPLTKDGTEKAGGVVVPLDQGGLIPHVPAYVCKECKNMLIEYE